MFVSEIEARGYSKPSFVGALFPRKQISVLASPPGMGKTWLSLAWAFDISIDGYIHGVQVFSPAAKVLFFCGEAGYDIMAERCNLLTSDKNPENINIVTLEEESELSLVTEEGFSRVCQLAKGYDIIIFDTLISFCGVEENSAKEMGDVFRRLRRMATTFNCAIVVNHHLRKIKSSDGAIERSLDDVIGSSAISRLAALVLICSRVEGRVKVRCVKTWYKEPTPFILLIRETDEGKVDVIASTAQGIPEPDGKKRVRQLALAMPHFVTFSARMIAESMGVSDDWTRKTLHELVKEGWLEENGILGREARFTRTDQEIN